MFNILPGRKMFKRNVFLLVYLFPALALYLIFYVYPYINAFVLSFYKWTGFSQNKTFILFQNFKDIFNDKVIWKALYNNVYILFFCTAITIVISMYFAVVITRKPYKENKFFKIVFFLPYVLSMAVVSIIWMFMYNPSLGLVNSLLSEAGLKSLIRLWLADPKVIMGALTVPLVWFNIGFFMFLFIAGILDIPEQLFEAADIDGAGGIQKFRVIIIPSIWEIISAALVYFVVTAFNYSFELVYVVTRGGPNRASELLTTYLYENAFIKSNFGYASAIGVVLFIIMFAITILVLRITRRQDD